MDLSRITPAGNSYNSLATLIASAGPDQSNILPWHKVTLSGSGSGGTITSYSWRQISGPSVVLSSTTDSAPVFEAPGLEAGAVLTFGLTVSDSAGSTSLEDAVQVTVLPVIEFALKAGVWQPFQTLVAAGGKWTDSSINPTAPSFLFGMTAAQIQALPSTGTAWNNVLARANEAYVVDCYDHGSTWANNTFANALLAVYYADKNATEAETRRQKVVNDLEAARLWNDPDGRVYQTWFRQSSGIICAADLVNHRTPEFTQFISDMRYFNNWGTNSLGESNGHSRWGEMYVCAWDSANNHGTLARSGFQAACLFVGDRVKYEESVLWQRRYYGDVSVYASRAPSDQSAPTVAQQGFRMSGQWDYARTWCHNTSATSTDWTPINSAVGDKTKDGCTVDDVIRDNTIYSAFNGNAVFGDKGNMYIHTAGVGQMFGAVVMAANGYPDVWQWSNQAPRRWRDYPLANGYAMPFPGMTGWCDTLLNHVYSTTQYPEIDGRGYGFGFTGWLSFDATWLR